MKLRLYIISLLVLFILLINGLGTSAQDTPTRESNLQRATVVSPNLPPVSQATLRQVTNTPRPTLANTKTPSPSATETSTPSPSATETSTPSPSATETSTPSPSLTETSTPSPSLTETSTLSPSATETSTLSPSLTETSTPSPSLTETSTPSPSATETSTPSPSATETSTPSPSATETSTPSPSATETSTPSPSPVPINISNTPPEITSSESNRINPILPLGLGVFALISLYIALYARNYATLDRYAEGFIMPRCPVCETGFLEVEERPHRILGIPRVRRTIRCDNCRSILREVGRRRWRYAVDPYANQPLFEEYNGRDLTEAELMNLAHSETDDRLTRYIED